MPALSFAVQSSQQAYSIAFNSDKRSSQAVSQLPYEQQVARHGGVQLEDLVEVDQQVAEPHCRTEVIKHVSDRVAGSCWDELLENPNKFTKEN